MPNKLTEEQLQGAIRTWKSLDIHSSTIDVLTALAPHLQYQREEVPAKIAPATPEEAKIIKNDFDQYMQRSYTSIEQDLCEAINNWIYRRDNPPKEDTAVKAVRDLLAADPVSDWSSCEGPAQIVAAVRKADAGIIVECPNCVGHGDYSAECAVCKGTGSIYKADALAAEGKDA